MAAVWTWTMSLFVIPSEIITPCPITTFWCPDNRVILLWSFRPCPLWPSVCGWLHCSRCHYFTYRLCELSDGAEHSLPPRRPFSKGEIKGGSIVSLSDKSQIYSKSQGGVSGTELDFRHAWINNELHPTMIMNNMHRITECSLRNRSYFNHWEMQSHDGLLCGGIRRILAEKLHH